LNQWRRNSIDFAAKGPDCAACGRSYSPDCEYPGCIAGYVENDIGCAGGGSAEAPSCIVESMVLVLETCGLVFGYSFSVET
jgi:hypothetical protein